MRLPITGESGQTMQDWWKICSAERLHCTLLLLPSFHGSVFVVITAAGLFPSTVVSVNLHTKELVPKETSATSCYYCTGHNVTAVFRGFASAEPFFFCISCTAWASTCCIIKQQKLRANFTMCLSQSEYFHQQQLPWICTAAGHGESREKESPRRDTQGGQTRQSSMFVFLGQWCVTSLSHPADCLLGLHAHT